MILFLQIFLLALSHKLVERFEMIATTGKNAKPHLIYFSLSA